MVTLSIAVTEVANLAGWKTALYVELVPSAGGGAFISYKPLNQQRLLCPALAVWLYAENTEHRAVNTYLIKVKG